MLILCVSDHTPLCECSILALACPRPWGSSRHAHGSPTSYTLLCPQASCSPRRNQQFILHQQGREHAPEGGALYGITKTMGPYGEQKDLPLGLFSAQQTARRIMHGSDTHEVSGTILNSKVALTDRWTSLTGARRRSREGRLANNVIVMAFVVSISRRVLKHRALNGGISVNLGHNTPPINPSTYAYC
ncbi:unnamed protein product [Pleuronectes platessa]|uniref:Uncharacterized protein n=1 Tax=Pleuronectes platessa TaxID=8262 RepID=A0A9N7TPM7_PLEPL|nr:unnamed protein product [Pleuronectes platessa]